MRRELWLSILARNIRGTSFGSLYKKLLKTKIPSEVDDAIKKDITRSFPAHEIFREQQNQESLHRVLRAYAAFDPETGYCQGMNFVAAVLLLHLLPSESDAFGAMVVLLQERGLRGHYTPDMSLLQARLAQLGCLLPKWLAEHLESHGVVTALYASPWFLTLFSSEYPLSFVGRVFDVMLGEEDGTIMMKVALRIMCELQDDLLHMTDMESILALIKAAPLIWDSDQLKEIVNDALSIEWGPQEMAVLKELSPAPALGGAAAALTPGEVPVSPHAARGERWPGEASCSHGAEPRQIASASSVPLPAAQPSLPRRQHRRCLSAHEGPGGGAHGRSVVDVWGLMGGLDISGGQAAPAAIRTSLPGPSQQPSPVSTPQRVAMAIATPITEWLSHRAAGSSRHAVSRLAAGPSRSEGGEPSTPTEEPGCGSPWN